MSRYKHKGVIIKHDKDKPSYGQLVKGMLQIINPTSLTQTQMLKLVNMPKPHKPYKERTGAQKPHLHLERDLQNDIIDYLNRHGCVAGKIKSVGAWTGRGFAKDPRLFVGCPDILCFNMQTGKMFWIECKIGKNPLSQKQNDFRYYCKTCTINHVIAKSVDDIKAIVTNNQGEMKWLTPPT